MRPDSAQGGPGLFVRGTGSPTSSGFFGISPEALPGRMKWRDTNNCRQRLERCNFPAAREARLVAGGFLPVPRRQRLNEDVR